MHRDGGSNPFLPGGGALPPEPPLPRVPLVLVGLAWCSFGVSAAVIPGIVLLVVSAP
jgi:hypothetical protein